MKDLGVCLDFHRAGSVGLEHRSFLGKSRFCTVNIVGIRQNNARGFVSTRELAAVLISGVTKNN